MEKEQTIFRWLHDLGYVNDRGWKTTGSKFDNFYSYSKSGSKFRFEIKTSWNLRYDFYPSFMLYILDCTDEVYMDAKSGYMGWLGQKQLIHFDREISKELFIEICKHFEIN